jgi:transposase
MGLDQDDVDASDDYYIDYEIYTGIFDFFTQGNSWRFAFQSYPGGNTKTGVGEHKRWGEARFPGAIFFNPNKECFRNLVAVKGFGTLRTTNASGIPDSCRIFIGPRQEAYRFNISKTDWEDGGYWDNISLAIVDGEPGEPVSVDIWQWIHDTFPANDTPGLAGNAAAFDTTTALIKNGLNIAPASGNTSRFDVPGDTTVVIAEGDSVRVDLVFRILPGPGNYVNPVIGTNSQLRAVSTSATPIPTPASGVANFWSNYMFNNGEKGTLSGHPIASSGPLAGQKIWSPHVWNSARMDTAEFNNFNLHKRGIVQPSNAGLFMTAYHETELASSHRGVLGISRNVCFVADTNQVVAITTVICGSGAKPPDVSYPPAWTSAPGSGFNGQTTTKEGTKIIPDGLLTPGAHVQYFIRREELGTGLVAMCPDTTRVFPQPCEGSEDGHRWQQFGVLPDRWKSPNYIHPVLGTPGRGGPFMLVIDQGDRRGDERVWVGVADTLGATRAEKWGGHNGVHAPGYGDVNDPANFVRRHIGQPGTTWDLYGIKAGESLNSGSGSLGSRGGPSGLSFNNPANPQINGKTSRIGPSLEMLEAYYKILYVLSGDLNSSLWGPFSNKSQNDVKIVQDFLLSGNPSLHDRGFFAEGQGFVEAMFRTSVATDNFLTQYLGVSLRDLNYMALSGNTAYTIDLLPTAEVDDDGSLDVYELDNHCQLQLDVLSQVPGLAPETAEASFYEAVGPEAPYLAGVTKHHTAIHPWISLVDGFGISNILKFGRRHYYCNVFMNVFNLIADVQSQFCGFVDVPNGGPREFLRLANNASHVRLPELRFGLVKSEHVSVRLYDVAGRLVRTVADRVFTAGEHVLPWDGLDRNGAQAARGIYFLKVQRSGSVDVAHKVVLLK